MTPPGQRFGPTTRGSNTSLFDQIAEACAEYGLEVARRALVAPTVSKSRPRPQPVGAVRWEDIEIRFVSDLRVNVVISGQRDTYNYEELGFGDRRKGTPASEILDWTEQRRKIIETHELATRVSALEQARQVETGRDPNGGKGGGI
jgi:hypothetical protein